MHTSLLYSIQFSIRNKIMLFCSTLMSGYHRQLEIQFERYASRPFYGDLRSVFAGLCVRWNHLTKHYVEFFFVF